MSYAILIVDDEQSMREMLAILLQKERYTVLTAASRAEAAAALAQRSVDLVITDLKLPDGDGIEILRHVKAASPETIVIVMTAYGSTETAVAALKLGAHDYLIKPFDIEELKIVVRSALESRELFEENRLLKAELRDRGALERLVGSSPAMHALHAMVRTVARTSSTVLVSGESGTGKELVARAIHALSQRCDAPFVSVNCGALPETLLESELFGHVKGAFTDAHQTKRGLFEAANRGTLFLDEVGEMPPAMQVKLLRVLQDKRVRKLGGTDEVEVDVRVIAATNRPLDALVKERRFREDLFYRLNVIPLQIPPLRERREDVRLLSEHFLKRFAVEMGKPLARIGPRAMEQLERYSWPGNVRELENVMERAVALETGPEIGSAHLPEAVLAPAHAAAALPETHAGFSLDAHLRDVEVTLVRRALEQTGWDRAATCRMLGLAPRSLRYLIHKHRLSPDKI
jgi:two-component system, NtrC family, response regulator PilR